MSLGIKRELPVQHIRSSWGTGRWVLASLEGWFCWTGQGLNLHLWRGEGCYSFHCVPLHHRPTLIDSGKD